MATKRIVSKKSVIGPTLVAFYDRYNGEENEAPPYSPAGWWSKFADRWLVLWGAYSS